MRKLKDKNSTGKKNNLKREHEIVLSALESANLKHKRLCLLKEVTAELSEREQTILDKTYAKKLSLAVSSILVLLTARGLVITFSTKTKQRFLGSKRTLTNFQIPEIPSRRRKVLALVENAVDHYRRAVRVEDVFNYAGKIKQKLEVSKRKITQDIIGLAQTGELKRMEIEVYGFRGNTFYLPSGLLEADYTPTDTSNWLEKTYKSFQIVWKNKIEEAEIASRKISPITTKEVREKFYKLYPDSVAEITTKRFINLLLYLSTANSPKLRKVNNPQYNSSGWLPIETNDKVVMSPKHFYTSDAERVEEAIRRFEKNYKCPANIQDVEDQINKDVRLELKSKFSIARMLNNAAKQMTVNKFNDKIQRKVKYVGSVDGRMYYSTGEIEIQSAETILAFWRLKSQFESLNYTKQIKRIEISTVPLLQFGRFYLLSSEIRNIESELFKLNLETEIERELNAFNQLNQEIINAVKKVEHCKMNCESLINAQYDLKELSKNILSVEPVGLIPSEVMKIVYPFYTTARKLKKDNQLVTIFHDAIKRFPNPEFSNRFSKNPRKATEYLFDRTDLLMHTASKWGNRFAHLQALIAKQELGNLRNPKLIFPLLKDKNFTVRLKAVSCLAFITNENIKLVLEGVFENDCEPTVRQLAKWALDLNTSNSENLKQLFSG